MKDRFVIIVVVLVVVITVGIIAWPKVFGPSNQVACTQEAKLCPDGSYVGRTGPKCEFAACPSNDLWKTVTDTKQGISYQYPDHLLTKYISAQAWPPIVQFDPHKTYSCPSPALEFGAKFTYCIQKQTEGAAGSIYTTYTYSTGSLAPDTTLAVSFTLRAVQCDNYGNPQRTECLGERETFDIDGLVDRIAHSVTFTK